MFRKPQYIFKKRRLCQVFLQCKRPRMIYRRTHKSSVINTSGSDSELDVAYVPHNVESVMNESNYFEAPYVSGKYFSLILPPPNITGNLHLGHALTGTVQDIFVRWKKMNGFETLWIPGLDHAGIATQVVVEKYLQKNEHKIRYEIGQEEFIKKIWNWKNDKSVHIDRQLKRLGLSLNWDRQVFTMDKDQANIISNVFIKLFDKGLIYRNLALVNWSCFLRSAIADIEVDHMEIDGCTDLNVPGHNRSVKFGRLIYFAYKLIDSDEEIIVASTRPETILGDVAVAVHPEDERFSKYIGQKVFNPFRNEAIPIIADEVVDRTFGTGAVKVTPGHDHTDFQIAKRHPLEILQIFDDKGTTVESYEQFAGMPRFEVREKIIDELMKMNLLRDIRDHKMSIPICSRSGDVVEFLLKPQWFLKCSEMAEKAVEDVKSGKLVIEPKHFEERWFDWLGNIRDWCISRQLWWGHRMPVFLCSRNGEERWVAANNSTAAAKKISSQLNFPEEEFRIEQDKDVLDTWFSSALLPFSVFGWPHANADFEKYYPLSLMETGHDILFFWVARMVMLGTEITGRLPFEKILLHGIICDSQGRKMSKSLGNVIAPENVIDGISLKGLNEIAELSEKSGILTSDELKRTIKEQKKMFPEGIPECGADALRYTLVSHNVKNHFINFDIHESYTNKLFCNKIWQATKFAKMWFEKVVDSQGLERIINQNNFSEMDQWILSRYSHMVETINDSLEKSDFHVAASSLKDFLYYNFCDVYLETVKLGLRSVDSREAAGHCWALVTCLDGGLRALHPFMPFITQHLHQRLPVIGERDLSYPKNIGRRNEEIEHLVDDVLETVKGIRRLKRMFNITKKFNSQVVVDAANPRYSSMKNVIEDLSNCSDLRFGKFLEEQEGSVTVRDVLSNKTIIYMSIPEEIRSSLRHDEKKLNDKRNKLTKDLDKMKKMISGSTYEVNVSKENREIHSKKVAILEEKITRIDYILRIV